MKPMLASDWNEANVRFPVIVQPKIDGVRALNMLGPLTGRSLKQHKNKYVTKLFSHSALIGLDGEMAHERETHPDLCRLTSSALSTITGEPFVLWWLFDYVTVGTRDWAYCDRLQALRDRYHDLKSSHPHLAHHLRIVPSVQVDNIGDLLMYDEKFLEAGFEGTITRYVLGKHKQGRSTVKEAGLLRIKRFVDFEFRVTQIYEGEENTNDAQINELGQQFRSSRQDGKIPNGMVGAMDGEVLADVTDASGVVIFKKGQIVRVGPGRLTHEQRKYFFTNQAELMQATSKGKFFPKGIKDKPRFPTWQSFRSTEDMS